MDIATPAGEAMPEPLAGAGIGLARLATGLLQGLYLYLLYRAAQDYSWPATEPLLFVPLLLVGLLFPVILVASLGHMHLNRVSNWAGAVAAIAAALGVYDVWRVADVVAAGRLFAGPVPAGPHAAVPSGPLCLCLAAGVFIAHSLVMAAARDGRRIASYPTYFDTAWKHAVQLAFSGLFVGVTWLVLLLGGQLFLLVKLAFLDQLLHKAWFAIPVSAFAFSCALHLTDVRPAIVRGIRALLLVLMSWILPVMTLIVGAFVLSLPFTGLASLWATRHASSVLLGAAAAFVVLVNAAWQDGAAAAAPAVRLSMRAACLLLVPVTAIAAYALALRVGDYGWTSGRIIAAACLLVASCYALGYAAAALRGRLAWISGVNVGAAFVVLATLLLLFSPAADPARLSVNSQVARLSAAKISVEKFDFAFLRFNGARYGREALARLDAGASGPGAALLRAKIAQARKLEHPWQGIDMEDQPRVDVLANLHAWPKGTRLPASFLRSDWSRFARVPGIPACMRTQGETCDAFVLDMNGDGKPEVLLVGTEKYSGAAVLAEDEHGEWRAAGHLPVWVAGCETIRKGLMKHVAHPVSPALPDLMVAGQRLHVEPNKSGEADCDTLK